MYIHIRLYNKSKCSLLQNDIYTVYSILWCIEAHNRGMKQNSIETNKKL